MVKIRFLLNRILIKYMYFANKYMKEHYSWVVELLFIFMFVLHPGNVYNRWLVRMVWWRGNTSECLFTNQLWPWKTPETTRWTKGTYSNLSPHHKTYTLDQSLLAPSWSEYIIFNFYISKLQFCCCFFTVKVMWRNGISKLLSLLAIQITQKHDELNRYHKSSTKHKGMIVLNVCC